MKTPPSLRDIYPTLTEEELKKAEANLRRYLEIAMDIYEEQNSRDVDTAPPSPTIKERSNVNLKN